MSRAFFVWAAAIKKTGQNLTRLKEPADAQGECGEDQVAG